MKNSSLFYENENFQLISNNKMNDISDENNLSQPTSSQINSTREEIEKEKREREHHREKFNAWLNNDYANVRKDNRKIDSFA